MTNTSHSSKKLSKFLEFTLSPQGEMSLLAKALRGTKDGKQWLQMVQKGVDGDSSYAELAARPLVRALSAMTESVLVPRPDNFTSHKRTPWAGTRIVNEVKKGLILDKGLKIVGESWEISGHPRYPNKFLFKYGSQELEVTLTLLEEIFAEKLFGKLGVELHGKQMPFLVKLLNSGSWKSYLEQARHLLHSIDRQNILAGLNKSLGVKSSVLEILDGNYHQIHHGILNLIEVCNRHRFAKDAKAQKLIFKLERLHKRMLEKNLSVQVHPTAGYKGLHPGEHSKNEAWIIEDAETGAGIYIGLKEGVTRKKFTKALRAGEDITEFLNFIELKTGDAFFIPAGTMHAIGAGVLLVEPQETSETTYHVYDYGRVNRQGKPRRLDIDDAMAVTDWDGPRGEKAVRLFRRAPKQTVLAKGDGSIAEVRSVINERVFQAHSVILKKNQHYKGTSQRGIQAFTVLEGSITVYRNDKRVGEFSKGQSFIIPTCVGSFLIKAQAEFSWVISTSSSL